MDMVDMVITRICFSGRKSGHVKDVLQLPNLVNLGLLVGLEALRPTELGVCGVEPPQEQGKLYFARECGPDLDILVDCD